MPRRSSCHPPLEHTLSTPRTHLECIHCAPRLLQAGRAKLQLRDALRGVANEPIHALPFLQLGRLAQLREPLPRERSEAEAGAQAGGDEGERPAQAEPVEWGWGVLVSFKDLRLEAEGEKGRRRKSGKGDAASAAGGGRVEDFVIEVLLRCAPGAEAAVAAGRQPEPAREGEEAELHVLSMPLAHLDRLSSVKLQMPADLRGGDARFTVLKVLREVERRFPGDTVPLLQPVEDMQVDDERVPRLQRKLEAVEARLAEPRLSGAGLRARLPALRAKLELEAEEAALRKRIKAAQATLMKDELKGMRRVLRRLGHVSEEGVIQNKGRVACEVSTADELLVTELIFSGVLNEMTAQGLAALLSCLVVTEGGGSKDEKGDGACAAAIKTVAMRESVQRMRDLARRIASVVEEAKLPVEVEEYVERFRPDLVDLVHAWCGGAKFVEVCKMCDWYEGSIVRTMHRLEELLRQLMDAAKLVGNDDLEARCAEARKLLIRDVVFAASLYT